MKETGFLLFSFDACLQLHLQLVLSLDTLTELLHV